MAATYGIEYSIFSDGFENRPNLDLTFTPIQDFHQVLIEDAYKKMTTPAGIIDPPTGQFWDPNTLDLEEYVGDSVTPAEIDALKARIIAIFDTETRYNVKSEVTFLQEVLKVVLTLFPSADTRPIQIQFTTTSSNISFQRTL